MQSKKTGGQDWTDAIRTVENTVGEEVEQLLASGGSLPKCVRFQGAFENRDVSGGNYSNKERCSCGGRDEANNLWA